MLHLRGGHRLQLLVGGKAFFPALIRAMDAALHEIRLETYIFRDDVAGAQVLAALERAAHRGVAVFVVVDGVGTPELTPVLRQRVEACGIRWIRYMPLGAWGLLMPGRWRRLHRKLCVVDKTIGFCGGINLLDDFNELELGWQTTPRLDFAVQVSGVLVQDIWDSMDRFWRHLQVVQALGRGRLLEARGEWRTVRAPLAPLAQVPGAAHHGISAGLVLRDNVRFRTDIERTYRQAIAQAHQEILVANAYFMPGTKMRRALTLAAQRGVRVSLLLSGRYEFFMQFHAGKPLYAELLAAGVQIFEYRAAFLHAKVAVIDGRWATVGSSNLDPLSLLLAREANVVVEDAVFAADLRQHLLSAMEHDSTPVVAENLEHRGWGLRFKAWLAYRLLRLTVLLVGGNY